MLNLTLFRPGDAAETAVNLRAYGDGVVIESEGIDSPRAHYFEDNQRAGEFIIKTAFALLALGYRLYTDDGVTE